MTIVPQAVESEFGYMSRINAVLLKKLVLLFLSVLAE